MSRNEIRRNEYNLNIPRYVDSSDPVEHYDIYSTMFGGIPESEINDLAPYWQAFPSLRRELFASCADRPYADLRADDIAAAIRANADVVRFKTAFVEAFAGFERCFASASFAM